MFFVILKMQDAYIEINSVPTHLYTWGFNFEEELKDKNIDKLVLVITGKFIVNLTINYVYSLNSKAEKRNFMIHL